VRYLSLFDGIGAVHVAWPHWECVGVAEIDPFANAVHAARRPHIPNLGDVTKIDELDVALLGRIDLVVFGSPCQDLSVAGNRAGLAGERSGLFHDAMRIVGWAREHGGCRFALWENVPGAFSSNKGRDFAAVVAGMAGGTVDDVGVPPKGWGTEGAYVGEEALVEWAVLDAQWFGVAQRRRRVFAVADFGDWADRAPILLEPPRLRGYQPTRSSSREDAPAGAGGSVAFGGNNTSGEIDVAAALNANRGCHNPGDFEAGTLAVDFRNFKFTGGPSTALQAGAKGCAPNHTPHALVPVPSSEIAHAICANEQRTYTNEGTIFQLRNVVAMPIAFDTTQITHPENRSDPQPGDPCHTLPKAGHAPAVVNHRAVRRLTPRECERLQGFPDDYTLVSYRGKPAADGPRYKGLGNSMAVPVMRWIGQQIDDSTLC
jgi:DNA (cytosine-5)-methyltransferase 1